MLDIQRKIDHVPLISSKPSQKYISVMSWKVFLIKFWTLLKMHERDLNTNIHASKKYYYKNRWGGVKQPSSEWEKIKLMKNSFKLELT